MATTRLQLRFQVWGPHLDPEAITEATKIVPGRSFRVGEMPPHKLAVHKLAGWEWHSEWGDSDLAPLLSEMMEVLRSHEAVFRATAEAGAEISLSVVGHILGDPIQTEAEAEAVGMYGGEGQMFTPFLFADRPSMNFDPPVLNFLTAILAGLYFHLDVDLDPDRAPGRPAI